MFGRQMLTGTYKIRTCGRPAKSFSTLYVCSSRNKMVELQSNIFVSPIHDQEERFNIKMTPKTMFIDIFS